MDSNCGEISLVKLHPAHKWAAATDFVSDVRCSIQLISLVRERAVSKHTLLLLSRVYRSRQAMAFQAIVAPALVLCGALLSGSNTLLAIGKQIKRGCAPKHFFATFSCEEIGRVPETKLA